MSIGNVCRFFLFFDELHDQFMDMVCISKKSEMRGWDMREGIHMMEAIKFVMIGYLSGSILFARICAKLLDRPDILYASKDGNPGTANAFQYGGFLCGMITLVGDLAKGFLPVFAYVKCNGNFAEFPLAMALVIAAPVLGHAFPIFFHFQGGKGIAVTFGCLLGVFPNMMPVIVFALIFVFFSLVLRVTPHFARTVVTYIVAFFSFIRLRCGFGIVAGFLFITMIVFLRMHTSKEQREKVEVRLLWMH